MHLNCYFVKVFVLSECKTQEAFFDVMQFTLHVLPNLLTNCAHSHVEPFWRGCEEVPSRQVRTLKKKNIISIKYILKSIYEHRKKTHILVFAEMRLSATFQ